ncbi:MAG: thiamine diphosphokinase [Hominilimicola sp.]
MRAVIIGNGDIKDYEYIKGKICNTDFIVCADGGYNNAMKMDIMPDVLIGDFDSASGFENVAERIKYPKRKDFTDGELAVMYAVEHGYNDVVLIAMTGDRLDHTIADILLLDKCENGMVIDDNNEIYLLKDRLEIEGRKGQTLSIIPINGDAQGITTSGLEYPLCDETLHFASSRGISNVMLDSKCEITIERGMAFVIKVEKA